MSENFNIGRVIVGALAVFSVGTYAWWRTRGSVMHSALKADYQSVAAVPGLADREAKEPGFVRRFLEVMQETGANPDKMAALMSEETGVNPGLGDPDHGAVGLIGWIPKYAKGISGYDAHELHAMTGIEQLTAVQNTIRRVKGYLTDPPMQGWGSHIGDPDSTVIARKGGAPEGFYEAQSNAQGKNAYDVTGKGYITAGDVRAKVYAQLTKAGGKRLNAEGQVI